MTITAKAAFVVVGFVFLSGGISFALEGPATTRPVPPEASLTVKIWPGKAPATAPSTMPSDVAAGDADVWGGTSLKHVSVPTLSIYRPAGGDETGVAILVLPGGGFTQLAMYHEGYDVCTWLNKLGITACLLKYRVPDGAEEKGQMALQDAQRAMALIRENASEWKIDPKRVGMMGFSAGGKATARLESSFQTLSYPRVDAVDERSSRPDFAMCIYPGSMLNTKGDVPGITESFRPHQQTPQTFICVATDDRRSDNAAYFYLALKQAGVNAELHVYSEGGHGFGVRPSTASHATWTARAEDWLKQRGILK